VNNNRYPGLRTSLIFQACCLAFLSVPALAAPQPPTAGTVLESVKEAPKAAKPDAQVIEKNPAAEAPSSAPLGVATLRVNGYHITGNTVFTEQKLLSLLTNFSGKDLTLDSLNDAAETIKGYYRDHHYFLAQAYLPPQRIANGMVEIRVLEGKLGKANVKMDKKARLKESVARNYLDALMPAGSAITESNIEKPLLLINDLPGVIVRSTLKPGAQVGEADLDVAISDDGKKFDGSVQLDNMGNRNSGTNRIGATVNGRNLTGLGDLLSVHGLIAEKSETKLGQLSYTMPISSYGTKVTGSFTDLTYKLGGSFANLNADGDAKVYALTAQHPLQRSRNNNLFVLWGYQHKDLTDRRTNGLEVDKHRIDDMVFGLMGDSRDGLLGGALNSFNLMPTVGHHNWGQGSINDSTYHTAGSFSKLDVDYKRLQNVVSNTTLLLSVSGQVASKNLTSAEKMSLGGPDGVRAHPVGEASGDDVALGTLELRRIVSGVRPLGGVLQFSAFYDYGYSHLNHNPNLNSSDPTHRTLQGYGVGVNLGKRDNFLFKLDLAFRTGEHSTDDDSSHRIWAQAIKWF